MDEATKSILQALIEGGSINSADVAELEDEVTKKKILQNKYENHIRIRERKGRKPLYTIKVEGKVYNSSTEEGLYKKLYDLEFGPEKAGMEDLFPEWMLWRRDNTPVSPRTLKNVMAEWEVLKDEPLVSIPIKKITASDLIALYRKWTRNRTMTSKRFNNLKSIINGLYAYANQIGIEVHNPNHEINMRQFPLKAVNNDYNVFTEADRRLILDHLSDSTDGYDLATCFDFHVTMRFAEIAALRWEDVHDDYIIVGRQHLKTTSMNDDLSFEECWYEDSDHCKSHTTEGIRRIYLIDGAKEVLRRAEDVRNGSEYVFTFEGRQLVVNTFNQRLKRHCADLGIRYHPSHKIRFCVASTLHKNGVPLPILKEMLGHTDIHTTLHYLRHVENEQETLKLLNAAL